MLSLPDDILLAIALELRCGAFMGAYYFSFSPERHFNTESCDYDYDSDCDKGSDGPINADLVSFVQVCKTWNHISTPILYRNIFLARGDFEAFVEALDGSFNGQFIRSLSLHVGDESSVFDKRPLTPEGFRSHYNSDDEFERNDYRTSEAKVEWSDEDFDRYGSILPGASTSIYEQFENTAHLFDKMNKLVSFSLVLEPDSVFANPRSTLTELINALPSSCPSLELDTNGHDCHWWFPLHVCAAIRR